MAAVEQRLPPAERHGPRVAARRHVAAIARAVGAEVEGGGRCLWRLVAVKDARGRRLRRAWRRCGTVVVLGDGVGR
eukprot:2972908-Prymnesium_polylepis.1